MMKPEFTLTLPFRRDVERWGVFTIGTGLGNARFTNRAPE